MGHDNKLFLFQHEERKVIFADNLRVIRKHNAEHALGLHTFTLGVNKFADMSNEEFVARFTAPKKDFSARTRSNKAVSTVGLPSEVDWRDEVSQQ